MLELSWDPKQEIDTKWKWGGITWWICWLMFDLLPTVFSKCEQYTCWLHDTICWKISTLHIFCNHATKERAYSNSNMIWGDHITNKPLVQKKKWDTSNSFMLLISWASCVLNLTNGGVDGSSHVSLWPMFLQNRYKNSPSVLKPLLDWFIFKQAANSKTSC